MGNVLGLIGELIPMAGGIYLILYFGGYKTPNIKNEKELKKFNLRKENHGKKIIVLGAFLIIFSIYNITRSLI